MQPEWSFLTNECVDLHGFSVKQARATVLAYLSRASRFGIAHIRFVTGRGNHVNPNGQRGVLFKAFKKWIRQSAFNDRIESLEEHTGFYEVRLKSHYAARKNSTKIELHPEDVAFIKQLAEEGDPLFQLQYADLLEHGQNVPQDFKAAFNYYKLSAEAGHPIAMHDVARCYLHGRGTRMDDTKANEWLSKADKAGIVQATLCLGDSYMYGRGVEQDLRRAVSYFAKAAAAGETRAMRTLASGYQQGALTLTKDLEKSFQWYKKAADKGDPVALYNVSVMLLNGKGTPVDKKQAFDYAEQAAKAGDPDAQTLYGQFYLTGEIVNQDKAKAITWLRRAAELGSCQAAQILIKLLPEEADYFIAKAAELGDVLALSQSQKYSAETDEAFDAMIAEGLRKAQVMRVSDLILLPHTSKFFLLDEMLTSSQPNLCEKAARALEAMADANDICSIRRLILCFGVFGKLLTSEPGDFDRMLVDWLEQGISLEDTKCMIKLGYYAQTGYKLAYSQERAIHLYQLAAQKGNPTGYFMLGQHYLMAKLLNYDFNLNLDQWVRYFEKAIELESTQLNFLEVSSGFLDRYHRITPCAELFIAMAKDLNEEFHVKEWSNIYKNNLQPFILEQIVEGCAEKKGRLNCCIPVSTNSEKAKILKKYGKQLASQGYFRQALEQYNRAIEFDEDQPGLWRQKGLMHRKLSSYELALIAFDRALSLKPECTKAKHAKAYILKQQVQYESALAVYQSIIKQQPADQIALAAIKEIQLCLPSNLKDAPPRYFSLNSSCVCS